MSGPLSILVVEDDDGLREVLIQHLAREGHHVTPAQNGRQAMRQIDSSDYDLVITDLLMPEADGLEVLQHIRTKRPRPAVIVMSGGGKFTHASQLLALAVQLGAESPLVKPFTIQQLLHAVQAVKRAPNTGEGTAGGGEAGCNPTKMV